MSDLKRRIKALEDRQALKVGRLPSYIILPSTDGRYRVTRPLTGETHDFTQAEYDHWKATTPVERNIVIGWPEDEQP